LQTSFGAVAQQVPSFSGQFRNLNLLVVGLNMLSDMMTRAKQMKDTMVALKSAPNPQAALAALTTLMTTVQGTSQAITTQFSNLGAAPAPGRIGGRDRKPSGWSPCGPGFVRDSGRGTSRSACGRQPTRKFEHGCKSGGESSFFHGWVRSRIRDQQAQKETSFLSHSSPRHGVCVTWLTQPM
jgi:hypothetical protein